MHMRREISKLCFECGTPTIGTTGKGRERCVACQLRRAVAYIAAQHLLARLSTPEIEAFVSSFVEPGIEIPDAQGSLPERRERVLT